MILAVLAISLAAMIEARAGTITAASLIAGCGSIELTDGPLNIDKRFNNICTMDIVFTVTNNPTPGVDLDLNPFVESVFNNTEITWTDFHMQLGFGFGTGFTPISPTCGAGFATLPVPESDRFTAQGVSSGTIDWGGGEVDDFRTVNFNFTFSVRDSTDCIPVGSLRPGGYTFTLRQTPTTVPEPATMLLLGTGLAAVAIKTRKRLKIAKAGKKANSDCRQP
jgi:hypothetical protein